MRSLSILLLGFCVCGCLTTPTVSQPDTDVDAGLTDTRSDAERSDTGAIEPSIDLYTRDHQNLLFMYLFDETIGDTAYEFLDDSVRACTTDSTATWKNGALVLSNNYLTCDGFQSFADTIDNSDTFSVEVWASHLSGDGVYLRWADFDLRRGPGNGITYSSFGEAQLTIDNFRREQMQHLIVSCSGETCQIYEDGILMDSVLQPDIPWQQAGEFIIGNLNGEIQISLLAVYDRPLRHIDAIRNYIVGPNFDAEAVAGPSFDDAYGFQFFPLDGVYDVPRGRFSVKPITIDDSAVDTTTLVNPVQFALFKWALPEFSDAATHEFSMLQLTTDGAASVTDTVNVELSTVLRDWTSDATNEIYATNLQWGQPGAAGSDDSDFVRSVPLNPGFERIPIDITEVVSQWFDQTTNNGFLIRGNAENHLRLVQYDDEDEHPFSVIQVYRDAGSSDALPAITIESRTANSLTWSVDPTINGFIEYEVYLMGRLHITTPQRDADIYTIDDENQCVVVAKDRWGRRGTPVLCGPTF